MRSARIALFTIAQRVIVVFAMTMPFSAVQFFDLFGTFNAALWPAVLALWVITLVAVVQMIRGHAGHRMLTALLALHWAWSGVVYHAWFFTRINPAAWLFAALFTLQAVAFLWVGLGQRRLRLGQGPSRWRAVGAVFLVLSLVYPLLSIVAGHAWPRVPAFGVPCPTTLFTVGLLLRADSSAPRWLFVIPIGWALVGGSAAIVLGVTPDLLLFAGAVALATHAVSGFSRSR